MYAMEEMMMKKQSFASNTRPSNSRADALGINTSSQTIAKVKPKIRIIHIFSPEIIKTDVANFRELVQRLTGKSSSSEKSCIKLKRSSRDANPRRRSSSEVPRTTYSTKPITKNMPEDRAGFHPCPPEIYRERIKGEEEIWKGANSGGGFLGGLAYEYDGFMADLNGIPFLPLDAASIDGYGVSQLA